MDEIACRPPRNGYLRINVKASPPPAALIGGRSLQTGLRGIIRDSDGVLIKGFLLSTPERDPVMVKLRVVFLGLRTALNLRNPNDRRLRIEMHTSDMEAEHAFRFPNHFTNDNIRVLVAQITNMSTETEFFSLRYVNRNGNEAANFVATHARLHYTAWTTFDYPFGSLGEMIDLDIRRFMNYRSNLVHQQVQNEGNEGFVLHGDPVWDALVLEFQQRGQEHAAQQPVWEPWAVEH